MSHKYSKWNRRRKLFFVAEFIQEHNIKTCLLVGAKPDLVEGNLDNMIELGVKNLIPNLVASGIERKSSYWENWIQADGKNLPFAMRSFDLVFSNAVIEHVGDERDQIKFLNEIDRVGKNWIVTTPNRFFPIESHTQKLIFHMRRGWKNSAVTRLLSRRDLERILPRNAVIIGHIFSPTFTCYKIYE